ncbi:very-long-chain 3-oxoacyl-CoA synthase [Sarracenia purpurea var. burkii]
MNQYQFLLQTINNSGIGDDTYTPKNVISDNEENPTLRREGENRGDEENREDKETIGGEQRDDGVRAHNGRRRGMAGRRGRCDGR